MDTPILIIKKDILEQNIKDMAAFVQEKGVKLRPHIKSHKMPYIAKLQQDYGINGITVAKLGEAEVMVEAGINDVFIAYQLIGSEKLERLFNLTRRAKITVAVDSLLGAVQLSEKAKENNTSLDIMVEIDSGLKRCGVEPGEEAQKLIYQLTKLPNLNFQGIFTHAGQSYGCSNYQAVEEVGNHEGQVMVKLAQSLQTMGIHCNEISVGSTPTAKIAGSIKGVTEIRPGNYVFNDAIQVGLGVAKEQNCSLRVVARVISIPSKDRAIIDAGSKVFALDKGAHGNSVVEGHGLVVSHPGVIITRLSEEHGIMDISKSMVPLAIGDLVEVVPNHACTVINLSSYAYISRDGDLEKINIEARGRYL